MSDLKKLHDAYNKHVYQATKHAYRWANGKDCIAVCTCGHMACHCLSGHDAGKTFRVDIVHVEYLSICAHAMPAEMLARFIKQLRKELPPTKLQELLRLTNG